MSEPAWELSDLEPVEYGELAVPIASWETTSTANPHLGHGNTRLVPVPAAAGVDSQVQWITVTEYDEVDWERVSAVVSLIPGWGTIKDIVEGISGEDMFTGEELSTRKRIFNFAAAAADLIGAGRVIKGIDKLPVALRVTKAVGNGAGKVNDAEDIHTLVK